MGENIADLAGLEIAYDAYHRSLGGKTAPAIDGLSGDQRFFLAFAQAWRDKARDDAIRQQVASNEHSPARWRIIGRSEEHTSELQSLMRISYAVFCLKKKNTTTTPTTCNANTAQDITKH